MIHVFATYTVITGDSESDRFLNLKLNKELSELKYIKEFSYYYYGTRELEFNEDDYWLDYGSIIRLYKTEVITEDTYNLLKKLGLPTVNLTKEKTCKK